MENKSINAVKQFMAYEPKAEKQQKHVTIEQATFALFKIFEQNKHKCMVCDKKISERQSNETGGLCRECRLDLLREKFYGDYEPVEYD